MSYLTTSFNPSGNRWVPGCNVTDSDGFAIPTVAFDEVSRRLPWILGSVESPNFIAVDLDGGLAEYTYDPDDMGGLPSETSYADMSLVYTRPLVASGNPLRPVPTPESASIHNHAVPIFDTDGQEIESVLFVREGTSLQQGTRNPSNPGQWIETEVLPGETSPLRDAHITYSETNGFWAIYTYSTDERYVHGILGDDFEGHHLHILKYENGSFQVVNEIVLEGDNRVFEGLAPMWTDVDGDGVDDLLTTIATSSQGAALRLYLLTVDGSVRKQVESDFIGTGGRWLHQLASGPLGPKGETEIVEIRTPHIGGIVRYFRYSESLEKLENVASTRVYTSHDINSRNIDQVLVADLNGDGIPELVVQTQAKRELQGLQRVEGGQVRTVWSIPLASSLYSNIALSCVDGVARLMFQTKGQELYQVGFQNDDATAPPQPAPTLSRTSSTPGRLDFGSEMIWLYLGFLLTWHFAKKH